MNFLFIIIYNYCVLNILCINTSHTTIRSSTHHFSIFLYCVHNKFKAISYKRKNVKRILKAWNFLKTWLFVTSIGLYLRAIRCCYATCVRRDWKAKNSRFERQLRRKHGRISAGLCRTCENVASFDTKITKGEFEKEKNECKKDRGKKRNDGRQFRRLFRKRNSTAETL